MEEHSKNQDKKKNIIEKYNSSSHFYDNRYKELQKEKYEILLKNYKAHGKFILDLGCGTGLSFAYLSKLFKRQGDIKAIYVGLDISWKMLLEFKSKIINFLEYKNILNLILSDIEYLPFRENIFCSTLSLTSFQNLPYIQNGIEESFRVSKNDADYKLSILKKKIKLESLLSLLKPKIKRLEVLETENLEDIIVEGKISKE